MIEPIIAALRKKHATPEAVLCAMGFDEAQAKAFLRDPKETPMKDGAKAAASKAALGAMLAADAGIHDIIDLLDALKAANMPAEEEANEDEPETEEDGDGDMEDNGGLPIPGGEMKKKAEDEDMGSMEDVGGDREDGGGMDKMAKVRECLKMLTQLLGAGEPETPAAPAIDEDPMEEKKDEPKIPGMDAKAVKAAINAAVSGERKNQRELRAAYDFVRPWVGNLAIACDSAEGVHRAAAEMLGIKGAKTIHRDALEPLIEAQPKPGARKATREPLAHDAASAKGFAGRYPDAAKIRIL